MARRLYEVMGNSSKCLVVWLMALLVLSVTEKLPGSNGNSDYYNSY